MNKRDPISNHGELVVGVDYLLLSLTFRQPNYGLAAVETETQNNMLRAIVTGLAKEMR